MDCRSDHAQGERTRPGPFQFHRSPMYRSTVLPEEQVYGNTKVGCESYVVLVPSPAAGGGSASQGAPHIVGACDSAGGFGNHLRAERHWDPSTNALAPAAGARPYLALSQALGSFY